MKKTILLTLAFSVVVLCAAGYLWSQQAIPTGNMDSVALVGKAPDGTMKYLMSSANGTLLMGAASLSAPSPQGQPVPTGYIEPRALVAMDSTGAWHYLLSDTLGNLLGSVLSVAESALTFTDITTNDVSTTKHGFTPKLPNSASVFLNGIGGYTSPTGTVPLTGTTGSIGGGVLIAGACSSGTATIANSTTAMGVVATPVTYPGDGVTWAGYVSTNGTVTVKVCAIVGLTPGATNYNVRVIQ